jgi:hypothetical protein
MLLQGPKLALVDFQFQLNFSWLKWLSMIPAVDIYIYIYIYIYRHTHTQTHTSSQNKALKNPIMQKGKKGFDR